MDLIATISRFFRNSVSRQSKDFDELIASGDITKIREMMVNRQSEIDASIRIYRPELHKVCERKDRVITDKQGNRTDVKKVWKLPIPYPQYINEISLVFLLGRPVKWQCMSDGTDEAFEMFNDIIKRTRFDAKIRQAKRLAGAETESAMLFRVYKNKAGEPDVQIRVLARSKGDELYYSWDIYENLINAAWGYYTREGDENVYHFDIFTADKTYRCTKNKGTGKWDVVAEENLIGKIPLIIFQQERECYGVEELIHREESIASRTADTNDYFSDPIFIASADVVRDMPDKDASNKTIFVRNNREGLDNVAKFLTWDNAPQSKKEEIEWLQAQILTKSFTPNITLDSLKSVSQLSAKALRTVMMLADIKASKHKEVYDEMLDRTASLILSIIGNVLAIRLKSQCERAKIIHEWQEPFGDDVTDAIDNIIKSVDGGIISQESAVEQNPLVKDASREMERIQNEQSQATQRQNDLFAPTSEDIEPVIN